MRPDGSSLARRVFACDGGQALGEYGLVLALAAGLRWLEGVGRTIVDDPLRGVGAAVAIVAVIMFASRPAR